MIIDTGYTMVSMSYMYKGGVVLVKHTLFYRSYLHSCIVARFSYNRNTDHWKQITKIMYIDRFVFVFILFVDDMFSLVYNTQNYRSIQLIVFLISSDWIYNNIMNLICNLVLTLDIQIQPSKGKPVQGHVTQQLLKDTQVKLAQVLNRPQCNADPSVSKTQVYHSRV